MAIPIKKKKKASTSSNIADVFKSFNEDGFALIPGEDKYTVWLFRRIWIIPVILITLMLISSVGIYLQVDKYDDFNTLIRWNWEYSGAKYTWCKWEYSDNRIELKIYPKTDRPCDELWDESEATEFLSTSLVDREAGYLGLQTLAILIIYIIVAAIAVPFSNFIRKVPKVFVSLALGGRLTVPVNEGRTKREKKKYKGKGLHPKGWKSFPDDLVKALNNKNWRYGLLLLWVVIAYSIFFYVGRESMFSVDNFWFVMRDVVFYLITPFLLAYLAGFGMWTFIVVGFFIRWLTPKVYQLNVYPMHGDGCGGLKRLGDLCFDMASMIMIPSIIIGLGLLLGPIRTPITMVTVVIILLPAMLLTSVTFFVPILDIHNEMVKEKTRFQDEAASSIAPVEMQLRELLARKRLTPESPIIKKYEQKLEKLHKLYPDDLNHPTWPFTTKTLVTFYTAQIVPITTVITGVIEFFRIFSDV